MVYLEQNKNLQKRILLIFLSFFLLSCNQNDLPFSGNNQIVIKVLNGNYITEDRSKDNDLLATGSSANSWEIFYIHYNEDNSIHIQTSTGNYVNYSDSILIANSAKREEAGAFFLEKHKQFYRIKTRNGSSVILQRDLRLKVSESKKQLFEIMNYSGIPASWFSLREIKWGQFLGQFFIFSFLIFIVFKYIFKESEFSIKMILYVAFFLLYVIYNTKTWKTKKVIGSDAVVYYEYLPAAFIFNDMSFNFRKNLPEDFTGTIWVEEIEKTGNGVPKTSMGMAIMYSPFFLIGHVVASIQGYTTYGYSEPYQMMIALGCFLYVFLALFYLRKILRLYFNDVVTAFTLFTIVMGTNLFYYTVREPGMSHAYSFLLVVLFIWNTLKWHQDKKVKSVVYIGLIIGLISLVRPTNVLIVLFFIFYQVVSIDTMKKKVELFWLYKKQLLIIVGGGFIVWLPQMIFWKYATGDWLFFSYGEERFYFDKPFILEGLFSYRKGWLLYTPIMIFALLGIGFLYKKQKELLLPIILFIGLNIYVVFSWWSWFYGGSFSSRPMVDSYGLLAIPLAAFFAYFDKKTNYLRSASLFIIFLTISLNLFQTQQTKTCLHWAGMTKESYLTNFTTLGWPNDIDNMLNEPIHEKVIKGEEEYDDFIWK